jgi:uracil phosphoribosyltransferase
MTIQVVNHPVLLHKLSLLRDVRTKSKQFRDLVYEVTLLLGMQATQTLDLIQTTRQVWLILFNLLLESKPKKTR